MLTQELWRFRVNAQAHILTVEH